MGAPRFVFGDDFAPGDLFLGGIQGAWYDPSDNATMFQDAAGLTPVTAVEQPVGLVFDKRLGPTARRNLLTYSEQFDNAAWFKEGGAVSANSTLSPDGTTTADTWTASATNDRHAMLGGAGSGFPSVANADYVFSAYVKKGTHNYVSLLVTNNLTTWFVATFDLSGATPVMSQSGAGAGGTFVSSSVESAANGFWRLSIRGRKTDAVVVPEIALSPSATPTYGNYGETSWAAAGTETIVTWGAQLEAASAASTYQKITSGIGGEWTPGNHAYQSTAASRPVLRARYNLLTYSEDFGNAAVWDSNRFTLTTNATTAPDGTVTADLLVPTTVTTYHQLIYAMTSAVSGATYVASYYVKPNGYTKVTIVENQITSNYVTYDLSGAGTVVSTSGATGTVTALANGWYRITHTSNAGGAAFRPDLMVLPNSYVSGTPIFTWSGDGTSGVYAWGAQLLTAADATATGNAYQRIEGAATYATGGVFRPYLAFDGVDDRLQTASVNIASNAVSLFAGHSIQTAGGWGTLVSSGAAGGGGVFLMISDTTGAAAYQNVRSEGTLGSQVNSSTFAYPYLDVWTMQAQISTDTLTARRNGAQTATSSSDQGSGSYASNIMYVGSYNGANWHYPGRIYGLIVRGAASTNTEVSDTEQWLAGKTGLVFGSLFPLLLIGQLIFSSPANSGQILTLGL